MSHVVSVQVGRPQEFEWLGRTVRTGIFKTPVHGPVAVLADHLDGDVQVDRVNHGGADKAVYAYAQEDLRWWQEQLDRPAEPGLFGENLTTSGLDLQECVIGEVWRVGSAVLQVSEPRTPCWKVGLRMCDPAFPRRFAKARRTGVLLRVLQTGHLQAGDLIDIGDEPRHGVRAADINEVYYTRGADPRPIYAAAELAAHWRTWADHLTICHINDEQQKVIVIDY